MTLPRVLDLTVEVSLDGSGDYTGADDDVTSGVAVEPGISIELGREGGRAISPARVPSASYELLNQQGQYSLESAASPVYQQLLPARPTRVVAEAGETRAYRSATAYRANVAYRGVRTWSLFAGALEMIDQTTDYGNERVVLDAVGTLAVLLDASVTISLQTAIRTDQAIALILDSVGWPSALRSISTGDSLLLYWWCDGRKAWDALLELLASEGPCQLYQDQSGVVHFEGRNYRTTASRSMTAQAAFSSTPTGSELWPVHFRYESGYDRIYNRATFETKRRDFGALGVVWEYGATLTLGADELWSVTVKPSNPFRAAIAPVSGTDFTLTSGTLATLTTLSATSGLVTTLSILAGGSGATLTGLQMRAEPLEVVSETEVENSVDASASISKYSLVPGGDVPRTLALSGWPEIEPAQAVAVCNAWVTRYQEPRAQVTLTLRNADAEHLRQIVEREVSDRIALHDVNSGFDRDVWVEAKTMALAGAGGVVIVGELACEVIVELTGAVWDVSEWDDPAAVWGV